MVGRGINKNLEKKVYSSFFTKYNNYDNFVNNYYKLKNFNNIIKKKVKKKDKITNYRVIKKLKTFKFISGRGQTKEQVFSRFKRKVIKKYLRKVGLKKKTIY